MSVQPICNHLGYGRIVCCLSLLLLLTATGCERRPVEQEAPPDDDLLMLGKPYGGQRLPAKGSLSYRFMTTTRGAYLIIVSDVTAPSRVVLQHPKKTCYLTGNGSCELVSSPRETYGFKIIEEGGQGMEFTLRVIHGWGSNFFEGVTADPVPVSVGQPYLGSVGVNMSSFYRFKTSARTAYTITVSQTHSNLSWVLFDRWVFDIILRGCDVHDGARDESCKLTGLWPHTEYYMMVSEQSGVPGNFQLLVQEQ
ncbi:MAG: hypothetical protein O7B79_11490 [SAR324 cluster bacterium]|nr:hypothetical protein [SAR324 cluster bacterium]